MSIDKLEGTVKKFKTALTATRHDHQRGTLALHTALAKEQTASTTARRKARAETSNAHAAEESLRLHDTTNKIFTMRHLFVATSRARDFEHLAIS